MLLRLIRSRLARRADIHREADALIAAFGEESWSVARSRAVGISGDRSRSDRAWDVVHRIERRLKIYRQPDTATRYLEGIPGRRR